MAETLVLAFGYLSTIALFLAAVAVNESRHSARRREREEARAAAHERLARHETRPWVDIDVEPRRGT